MTMSNLERDLQRRALEGRPITVAIVGAGQMGKGLAASLARIVGMQPALIADIDDRRAERAFLEAGVDAGKIVQGRDAKDAQRALKAGNHVILKDAALIPQEGIEAVVEATGVPAVGARVALDSIRRRQHLVLLNVETDVTVGRLLNTWARAAGVVYTVSAGDEPGATVELVEFARTLGFEVIAAGKGKNNTLDPGATPDSVRSEAKSKGASPHMFCSFVDGSKTMVEMTAVANATGLEPERPGMRGPELKVDDLAAAYRLEEQGGFLTRTGVVDYVHGIAPGVFVVITTASGVIRDDMAYLKVGPGPNWTLYRPYHLANLETPHSIAKAVLYHDVTIAPGEIPVAETVGVAKRDLSRGTVIDGIGGYTVRGWMLSRKDALASRAVPLGILEGAEVIRDVPAGGLLTEDDVRLDGSSLTVMLRKLQEAWLAPAART